MPGIQQPSGQAITQILLDSEQIKSIENFIPLAMLSSGSKTAEWLDLYNRSLGRIDLQSIKQFIEGITNTDLSEKISVLQIIETLFIEAKKLPPISAAKQFVDQFEKNNLIDDIRRVVNHPMLALPSEANDLVKVLKLALNPPEISQNGNLGFQITDLIKTQIGAELFSTLIRRYQLKEDKLNLDDLRMLIIGVLANQPADWKNNQFIQSLAMACGVNLQEDVAEDAVLMQNLIKNAKIPSETLEKITKQKILNTRVNKLLNILGKTFLKSWKFILPIKFKANKEFRQDLNLIDTLSSIEQWEQNIADPELKDFAANEFVFNKLSNLQLNPESIIPILDDNGATIFCKVKKLIDEKSVHGFALIPIDPTKSQNIKIVFQNNKSLSQAVFDSDHYLPYREFKKHRQKIMQNLNSTISKFQSELASRNVETVENSISLDIGGHGTGGTLAQLLINELATEKAAAIIAADPGQRAEIKEFIASHAKEQIKHEAKYHNLSVNKQEVLKAKIIEYSAKHILKEPYIVVPEPGTGESNTFNDLKVKDIKLFTVNAGGIPNKIRYNFIQAMWILKLKQQEFNLSCNKIIVDADIVHKTGETDLAAYVDSNLMHTKLLKVNANIEKSYSESLVELAARAAVLTTQYVVGKVLQGTATALFYGYLFLNVLKAPEEIEAVYNNMQEIFNTANKAHRDPYFNLSAKERPFCDICDNVTDNATYTNKLNQELTNKFPNLNTNRIYRKVKKRIYMALREIQKQFQKLIDKPHAVAAPIINSQPSIRSEGDLSNLDNDNSILSSRPSLT